MKIMYSFSLDCFVFYYPSKHFQMNEIQTHKQNSDDRWKWNTLHSHSPFTMNNCIIRITSVWDNRKWNLCYAHNNFFFFSFCNQVDQHNHHFLQRCSSRWFTIFFGNYKLTVQQIVESVSKWECFEFTARIISDLYGRHLLFNFIELTESNGSNNDKITLATIKDLLILMSWIITRYCMKRSAFFNC